MHHDQQIAYFPKVHLEGNIHKLYFSKEETYIHAEWAETP